MSLFIYLGFIVLLKSLFGIFHYSGNFSHILFLLVLIPPLFSPLLKYQKQCILDIISVHSVPLGLTSVFSIFLFPSATFCIMFSDF